MNKLSACCLISLILAIVPAPTQAETASRDVLQPPPEAQEAQQLYLQSKKMVAQRQWLEAAQLLQQILAEYPHTPAQNQAMKLLGDVNIQVIRSDLAIPQTTGYIVQPGETIGSIAQKLGTTETLIKSGNHLQSAVIVPGQKLRVWTQPFVLHISKARNTLTLMTNGETVKIYPVATGAENQTPPGEFSITSKLENPTWFKKGEPIPPESPRNALGSRWLGLNESQYGIHGTIQPELIGQPVSHGCVRMLNKDVEELYDLVPIGAKVIIHEE